ncbi:hypothetical protein ES708_31826 [subsurface metagenome]
MEYSIGHLLVPEKDDPQFDDYGKAEEAAIAASYDDGVWAVWENESGEIQAIVYQQQVFTP